MLGLHLYSAMQEEEMAGGLEQGRSIVRVHKRLVSDQQRRREVALERQKQARRDLQNHARQLAFSLAYTAGSTVSDGQPEDGMAIQEETQELRTGPDDSHSEESSSVCELGFSDGAKLRGAEARKWWSQQLMLPEWMVDIPSNMKDWYVMPRPTGKRCLVVSSNGQTVSRLRNGRILHSFPSALPNGARSREVAAASHIFCILDCIFYEPDATYYVLDLMCWRGYSLFDCTTEFRFFWMNSKLAEAGACGPPTARNRYKFSVVPVYECDSAGLQAAYSGHVPYEKEGLLFYNRHAHYVLGLTPLALTWKDRNCCQYLLDTDSQGNVPAQQQVVLELQSDGTVATSDSPPVVLGSMPQKFLDQNKSYLKVGMLLRFAIGDEGLCCVDGKPVAADIHYQGVANRQRPNADSCSKIMFQYAVRQAPVTFQDLLLAVESSDTERDEDMA